MHDLGGQRGFTLIELILILVVMAILAVAAIPYLEDTIGMKASATARRLQSDIAYTQELAMTRNQRYRLVFPLATSYEVRDASGNLTTDPAGGGGLAVITEAGITLSWNFDGETAAGRGVEFDSLGRPYVYAGTTPSSDPLDAGTVAVAGGGANQTVTVQSQTGKVSIP
jgi:prepilin-type N-terminal cleavage/methylation domain-containing protein